MGGEQAETTVDVGVVGTAEGDGGVPHGQEVLDFVDAAMTYDPDAAAEAREALTKAVGEAGMVDAAAVTGMFQWNTRAADTIGIPIEEPTRERRSAVGELFGFDARGDGLAP